MIHIKTIILFVHIYFILNRTLPSKFVVFINTKTGKKIK